jgi:hypothetical protein
VDNSANGAARARTWDCGAVPGAVAADSIKLITQTEIPETGFILPDGNFLDVKRYGVRTHSELAQLLLNDLKESSYGNLIKLIQMGFIRFTMENSTVTFQAETTPTRQQMSSIRKIVDFCSKGVVEIFRNENFVAIFDLFRETLDTDILKLEAIFDKAGLPDAERNGGVGGNTGGK